MLRKNKHIAPTEHHQAHSKRNPSKKSFGKFSASPLLKVWACIPSDQK